MRRKPNTPRVCHQCGGTYTASRAGRKTRFCSYRCAMLARIPPLAARLDAKIARSDDPNACWPWLGTKDREGYGGITVDGRRVRVSRAVYEQAHGPIPKGHIMRHTCDNPPCARLDHLVPGTVADNNADKGARGRAPTGTRSGQHTHPERTARGERNGAYTHPERVARGEQHGNARLTDEQATAILLRYRAGGITQVDLGREYGVSTPTVWKIVNGRSWKHATSLGSGSLRR